MRSAKVEFVLQWESLGEQPKVSVSILPDPTTTIQLPRGLDGEASQWEIQMMAQMLARYVTLDPSSPPSPIDPPLKDPQG